MKRVILALLIWVLFCGQAVANSADIFCDKPQCALTFSSYAGFLQKVFIRGPNGFSVSPSAQGEGTVGYRAVVSQGAYNVSFFHYNQGWQPSAIRANRNAAFANDSGADTDFNDAIVSLD